MAALRQMRISSPAIALALFLPSFAVIKVSRLELGSPPVVRCYAHSRPGEMIPLEIKKLGRIAVLDDEKAATSILFPDPGPYAGLKDML